MSPFKKEQSLINKTMKKDRAKGTHPPHGLLMLFSYYKSMGEISSCSYNTAAPMLNAFSRSLGNCFSHISFLCASSNPAMLNLL